MAAALAGCKSTDADRPSNPPPESTLNERDAEETVRRALQCYAEWNLEGAYQLICRQDRAKITWEQFRQGSEKNKEQLIRNARNAQIVHSGESSLPDGTPYVSVIVRLESGEVVPYSVMRQPEGWRLILVDPKRARQAKE
jgi:hypothetical protein